MGGTSSSSDLWTRLESLDRQMTWSQIGANFAGAITVTSYFVFFVSRPAGSFAAESFIILAIMFPILVLIASRSYRRWEKDLQNYAAALRDGQPVSEGLKFRARRKILDLPFVTAALSGLNWLLAALVMTVHQLVIAEPNQSAVELFWICASVFIGVIISGCVTIAIVFFATERDCRHIRPYFFPEGGLGDIPGALKLRLRDRMLIIFILVSILPVTLMAVLSLGKTRMMLHEPAADVVTSLMALTAFVLVVTVALAIVLSRYFASGILTPIRQMENAMQKVAGGDFEALLPLTSNDELGALSDHFNRMTGGLKERERMKQSLNLAKEVQQSLLPSSDPEIAYLDIAGRSVYCDETGGDYFDYLDEQILGRNRFGVVVGDVSGHGLPSAIMMATVRAALRQRASMPGTIGEMISDVNRQFSQDVEETGGFVTLLFLVFDAARRRLDWVRAGHDPGLFYDPASDRFSSLAEEGIAVGLTKHSQYNSYSLEPLAAGQIILLGTDGIWETRNPAGAMFGRKPVRDIIRRHHRAGSRTIGAAIFDELARFRQSELPEDDVTLVVVKVSSLGPDGAKSHVHRI